MCGVAEAFAIISAASAAASQQQQVKAAEQTAESAHIAHQNQQSGLLARAEENRLKATADMTERQRQHMRERSMIRAATAESGLTGISPLRNLVVSDINASLDHDTLALNQALATDQTRRDLVTSNAQRTARIDGALGNVPSAFGQALQITQAGLGGYVGGDAVSRRLKRNAQE